MSTLIAKNTCQFTPMAGNTDAYISAWLSSSFDVWIVSRKCAVTGWGCKSWLCYSHFGHPCLLGGFDGLPNWQLVYIICLAVILFSSLVVLILRFLIVFYIFSCAPIVLIAIKV